MEIITKQEAQEALAKTVKVKSSLPAYNMQQTSLAFIKDTISRLSGESWFRKSEDSITVLRHMPDGMNELHPAAMTTQALKDISYSIGAMEMYAHPKAELLPDNYPDKIMMQDTSPKSPMVDASRDGKFALEKRVLNKEYLQKCVSRLQNTSPSRTLISGTSCKEIAFVAEAFADIMGLQKNIGMER